MTRIKIILKSALIILILIVSCKNSSSSINQPPIEESKNISDYDGNTYKTVKIGGQIWMAENLKTKHYSDGVFVESFSYNNDATNAVRYGRLYKWKTAVRTNSNPVSVTKPVQGICPNGWHLPDDSEWQKLIENLGGPDAAGGKMKDVDPDSWDSPNTGATNESKFSAIAAGFYRVDEVYMTEGEWAVFASSSGISSIYVKVYNLSYDSDDIKSMEFLIHDAVSVRCVKD